MEKLTHHELLEVPMKSADDPLLEDRCLQALSELSSSDIPDKVSFFMSSNGLNRVGSLTSDPGLKPVIRESANNLLTLWMRQLYRPAPPEKPITRQNPNPKAAAAAAPNKADAAEKLALQLVEIAIETAATVSQPLDDRCIKALRKLSGLDLRSEFIMSSDIANMVDYYLYFNDRLKPLIRGYAARLLARWTARLLKPACDPKTRSKTKTKAASLSRKRKAVYY